MTGNAFHERGHGHVGVSPSGLSRSGELDTDRSRFTRKERYTHDCPVTFQFDCSEDRGGTEFRATSLVAHDSDLPREHVVALVFRLRMKHRRTAVALAWAALPATDRTLQQRRLSSPFRKLS